LRPATGVAEAGTEIGVSDDEAWPLELVAGVVPVPPAVRADRGAPELGRAAANAGEGGKQASATSAAQAARMT
jgi:hypothetical protein